MTLRPDIADHQQRILIVDDERANRRLLEVMLGEEGFLITTATNGEEALALVAKQQPDLILLDIMMPGMDGNQVAATIKGNLATKNIPVIIVSALDDRRARMLALNAGAEDFLSRPVDRAELRVRVRNLLRLKAYGEYHDKYSQLLEREVQSRTADLVERERMYRSTFDAAPVGIVHVGLDGRWLHVNQRLCDLLGRSREELQGAALATLLLLEDVPGEAEACRQMVAGTLDRHVLDEKRYLRGDGSYLWARVNMSVHRDAEGRAQYLISVIEDITERRTLEAQVRQASKMDAIGRLASGIAHDFNNVLSVVLSYSQMLADELEAGDPMRADLEEIKGVGLRAVDLTRQLLAFSRQQVLQPTIADLTEIVGDMEKMLRRLIGEDVILTTTCAPAPGRVMVDPGQMQQVIMNLVANARDSMPQGGTLTIETAPVVLDEDYAFEHDNVTPGPHVMLVVSDTGVGMDSETRACIFEPFFTTKDLGKGTGLGLATVFGIVRQSGGTIRVDSEPGKGSTFRVYFPTTDQAPAPHVELRPDEGASLFGSETILVVEDDEPLRLVACTILRRLGYQVLEAQNGGDALLLCEQHATTIHLLLTDVVMPRMSGRQLAQRLFALRPEMKVLYMSGYTDEMVVRHGVLDSSLAFVQKPITPSSLVSKVRETLGS